MLALLLTFVSNDTNVTLPISPIIIQEQSIPSVTLDTIYVIANKIPTITTYSTDTTNFGLSDAKVMALFIKYIKTQSNTVSTDVGKRDVYYVVQTMINRLREYNVDWMGYYNSQRINCSNSIKRMKTGHLRPSFSLDSKHDQVILNIANSVLDGTINDSLKLRADVLYFHSHGKAYNRGPHTHDKFATLARHRFYYK